MAMPDMAVITRQDNNTPRLSGRLQQSTQGANGLDRPGIAHLLGIAQAVVDCIDHDPHDFVLLRRNALTHLRREGSTTARCEIPLVVQHRWMAALADRGQASTGGKASLLVVGVATAQCTS